MKVYMRHVNDSDAVPFGECGILQLPEVVKYLREAGVYHDEIGGRYVDKEITSQICVDDTEAYAEIILGDE